MLLIFFSTSFQLERYFQKSAARLADSDGHKRERRRGRFGEVEDSSIEASMDVSKENSRASSVENDVSGLTLSEPSTRRASDEDDLQPDERPKRRGRRAKPVHQTLPQGPTRRAAVAILKLTKHISSEDSQTPDIVMTDSNSSTPPLDGSSSSSRPVRAAVANANAISEAQMDMQGKGKAGSNSDKKVKNSGSGSSSASGSSSLNHLVGRKKKNAQIASRISGLDLLHDTTMECIDGKST